IGSGASSLYDLDLKKKVALVFGNEHRGVSEEAAAASDATFMIPMHGMIQSLNVSVACAVTLFEAVRQRERSGQYDKGKFSEAELTKLLKAWATKP
ncbi:MAG: TrmH family RNA methyltransferase, partial [Bacteroidota bacterium]